jgi:hypothetical protein
MTRPIQFTSCTVVGCDKPHQAHGLCADHYQRYHQGERIRVGVVACGLLTEPQLAVLDAIFANGPLQRVRNGWAAGHVILDHKPAMALVRRGYVRIRKSGARHEELLATRAGEDLAMRINGCPAPVWKKNAE